MKALFTLRLYKFTEELISPEFQRPFYAQDAILQFRPDKDSLGGFRFTINGRDGDEWFGEKHNELLKTLGVDVGQRLIKKTQQH